MENFLKGIETIFYRLLGWVLSTYSKLVWRSVRYQVVGQEHENSIHAAGRPLIIASWHGMAMMLAGYLTVQGKFGQYVVVVPDNPRGAVLEALTWWLGATPFTISTQIDSMAATRRLATLIREMKQGKNFYVNPDGPDGPSHEPKRGVVFIARKSRALIVPAGAFTATGLRVPRWDRYVLPFPFSRISVVLGEPVEVSARADLDEQTQVVLRERLNEAERAAEELYRTGRCSTDRKVSKKYKK